MSIRIVEILGFGFADTVGLPQERDCFIRNEKHDSVSAGAEGPLDFKIIGWSR